MTEKKPRKNAGSRLQFNAKWRDQKLEWRGEVAADGVPVYPAGYAQGHWPERVKGSFARQPMQWDEEAAWYRAGAFNRCPGGEQLYRAKILQALLDLANNDRGKDQKNAKTLAWALLIGGTQRLRACCLEAGLDHEEVRAKALHVLEHGLKWREEAGKGARYEERKRYRQRRKAMGFKDL